MSEKLAPETLHALEETLARAIGPIARIVLTREAHEATNAENLLAALADRIPGEQETERFLKAADERLREDHSVAGAQLGAVISEADKLHAAELLRPLIGPLAKVIAEREAATAIGLDDYYEHLARKISNIADREIFLTAYRRSTRAANS